VRKVLCKPPISDRFLIHDQLTVTVPDYISYSSKIFDDTLYRDEAKLCAWHAYIREMLPVMQQAQPTALYQVVNYLATEKRLRRMYTQNIDGIETKLAALKRTVPLNPSPPFPNTIQLHHFMELDISASAQRHLYMVLDS
jgi:NAD-dependent SIR2 family protein deacetylase